MDVLSDSEGDRSGARARVKNMRSFSGRNDWVQDEQPPAKRADGNANSANGPPLRQKIGVWVLRSRKEKEKEKETSSPPPLDVKKSFFGKFRRHSQ